MTDNLVASNQNISIAAGDDEFVTGDDDIITAGAGATLSVHGYYDAVDGGYGSLTLIGIDLTANANGDQINVVGGSVVTVNGGNDTIVHHSGYITINNAGDGWDTLSGTILEITLLAGSRLILDGDQFDVYMAPNCTLQVDSDDDNIFGSDDRVHTGGAFVGGALLKGDSDRVFVGPDSQLEMDGNNNVAHADDLSSLAVSGTNNRLIGANFSVLGATGAQFYIGGNGARGAVDTVTATDATIRIGDDSNIMLNGDDDTATVLGGGYLYFVGAGLTARINANETVTINSNGHTSGLDLLSGVDFSLVVSTPANVELSTLGASVLVADDVTLSLQRSNNVIGLANSDNVSILWGGSNELTLGANDVINDGGSNTKILVGTVVGATTIHNFGADTGGIIDLFNGINGYTTTAAAYAALTSDGAGGLSLPLGAFGSIDFAGTSSLSQNNFKIN